jgi:hypothetical protein
MDTVAGIGEVLTNHSKHEQEQQSCIFPTLTDDASSSQRWETLHISRVQAGIALQYWDKRGLSHHLLGAAIWATILRQLSDMNSPQIWLQAKGAFAPRLLMTRFDEREEFASLSDWSAWGSFIDEADADCQRNTGLLVSDNLESCDSYRSSCMLFKVSGSVH